MAESSDKPATNMILNALKKRFEARNTGNSFPGGIQEGDIDTRRPRPYLIVVPVIEETRTRTNVSLYQRVVWQCNVIADTIERAGELSAIVKTDIEYQALSLEGGALRNLIPPTIIFFKENELHKAQLAYEATVRVPRNATRGAEVK